MCLILRGLSRTHEKLTNFQLSQIQEVFFTNEVYCFFFLFYQSDDCTVFFFTVGDTYKPIGFIETASPVVSIEWSKDRKVKKVFKGTMLMFVHLLKYSCLNGPNL